MTRFFFALLLLIALPALASAQDKAEARPVPDLVFSQQVNIVVAMKQDARVYDVQIKQQKEKIKIDMIVDKNVEREQAKKMAHDVVMLAKSMSLDDPPKDKNEPGKGLYSYRVSVSRPDGVSILVAYKPDRKSKLKYEDQVPDLRPLTRADANGL